MPAPSAAKYPSTLDDDTTLFKLSDRKSFTLNGSLTDTAVALTVNESCAGLTGNFYLVFATGEMIYVTAVNTGTKVMTIVRGASGTSATTHNNAEGLKMIVTAQIFEQFKRVILAIEGELGVLIKGAFSSAADRLADAERRLRYHTHDGTTDFGPRIDADTVDTFHATATPAAARIPVADGSGKLDGWISQINASTSVAGKIAIATSAEINAGSETSKALTPSNFSQSVRSSRFLALQVLDALTEIEVSTEVGNFFFATPDELAGYKLVSVWAASYTFSTEGPVILGVKHHGVDFLSSPITIPALSQHSRSAGTPQPTINPANAALSAGMDWITVQCLADGVWDTGAPVKGLQITLEFRLP